MLRIGKFYSMNLIYSLYSMLIYLFSMARCIKYVRKNEHMQMARINKFYSITVSEFDRRVGEVFNALGARDTPASISKYMYEAHQEAIMQLLEEALGQSSVDHLIASSRDPIYLVLIGDPSGDENRLRLNDLMPIIQGGNIHGIIFYNVETNIPDIILYNARELNLAILREVHWYDDINPGISTTSHPSYLDNLNTVGLYGYATRSASRFQSSINENRLQYLTIDTLGLGGRNRLLNRAIARLTIDDQNTAIRVIDFDEHYPYEVKYEGAQLPPNLEWVTFKDDSRSSTTLHKYVRRRNDILHTIVIYRQRSNWEITTLPELLELNVSFVGVTSMIPMNRYPNLDILKVEFNRSVQDRTSDVEIPRTFSQLQHLRVLHIFGEYDLIYRDVFDRVKNVEDLKMNKTIMPSVTRMLSLRYLTINNPLISQLETIVEFARAKNIWLSLSGSLRNEAGPITRDELIEEMVNYIESDAMIDNLTRMLARYPLPVEDPIE